MEVGGDGAGRGIIPAGSLLGMEMRVRKRFSFLESGGS